MGGRAGRGKEPKHELPRHHIADALSSCAADSARDHPTRIFKRLASFNSHKCSRREGLLSRPLLQPVDQHDRSASSGHLARTSGLEPSTHPARQRHRHRNGDLLPRGRPSLRACRAESTAASQPDSSSSKGTTSSPSLCATGTRSTSNPARAGASGNATGTTSAGSVANTSAASNPNSSTCRESIGRMCLNRRSRNGQRA